VAELPAIAVTMGDPAGVGPEVVVRALLSGEVRSICRPVVVGDAPRLRLAAERCGLVDAWAAAGVDVLQTGTLPPDLPFGEVSATAGDAAYGYVARAVELALAGEVGAICTAPLNKEALNAAGHAFAGHTELLAELSGSGEVSMLLSAENLRVLHVTTHVGLLDAVALIDAERVYRTIRRGFELVLGRDATRRIGVCGINPHAGEHGLFGRGEEEAAIVPAVRRAVAEGIAVEGPLPADTLFYRARRGDFDLVVAMYHDQGHAPIKVLGLDGGVNTTMGLPFVRTSVDHGTAFDIAGRGVAEEGSMVAAIRLAVGFLEGR
jgi:4-phospho-D-threonate 3-dehydrogenase / 4-phospho-D-erythronate 3-dehydrogenase